MRKVLFLLSCAVAAPAAAEDGGYGGFIDGLSVPDWSITVVARGYESHVREVAQPITVIPEHLLDDVQGPDLARVLQRAPGVTLTRNGGLGGFTGVRLRGAASEQVLVLVDGVRVADVAAPGGGFDFGNMLAGGLSKVEILRGPNSVVWGSDAIAGVINLTTRAPDGMTASAEYGGDEALTATLGGGIRRERLELGLTGSFHDSDGFSQAASGSEHDGFRQWQVTGRGKAEIAPEFWLTANGRYATGELDLDGYPPPDYAFSDTDERQDTREWSGRIGGRLRAFGLRLDGGYAVSDTLREYRDLSFGGEPYYTTQGRSERAELFGRTFLGAPELAVDFGASREWTRFDDSGTAERATITGVHVMPGWYGPRLTLAAGLRYDDHSRFGHAWTFGAHGAVEPVDGLRLRAGYGEGFKAPSLFQSQSALYGNPALDPERSKAWDAGLEWRRGTFNAGLSAFRRDSENLIDYVFCGTDFACADYPFGTYDNVGRARAEGFELELGAQVGDRIRTGAAYSYVETEDRTPGSFTQGNDLPRRPRHALTVTADWAGPVELGADVRLVGDSFDDRWQTTRLDGYVTADLRASVPFGRVELFGRVENVFDAGYRTVAGYNTAGRSAYLGARYRM